MPLAGSLTLPPRWRSSAALAERAVPMVSSQARSRGDQPGQPQIDDLRLLGRGDVELAVRVVVEAGLQRGQDVVGAEPGRRDQEDVAEALLVVAGGLVKSLDDIGGRTGAGGLLVPGPGRGPGSAALSDARMC